MKIPMEHINTANQAYAAMPIALKETVQYWIKQAIAPASHKEIGISSYGLKHIFAKACNRFGDKGINPTYSSHAYSYMTDQEFQGAMLATGYLPTNPQDGNNWDFKIKSRCRLRIPKEIDEYQYCDHDDYCLCHISEEEKEKFAQLAKSLHPRQLPGYPPLVHYRADITALAEQAQQKDGNNQTIIFDVDSTQLKKIIAAEKRLQRPD